MVVEGTPVTHHPDLGLFVKHEEQCCPGGPNFSKTRGVFAHIQKRPEKFIGVLDTRHSQGGWAVARACKELGKTCSEFYPILKADKHAAGGLVQEKCRELGAQLLPLKAGRSAVLYHRAKKHMLWLNNQGHGVIAYMMPNALKLHEMVTETAAEVRRTRFPNVATILISASSGTIAAGLIKGLWEIGWPAGVVVHMGYDRAEGALRAYMEQMAALPFGELRNVNIVNEHYAYADTACEGPTPPFPCNEFYDLKAFRWWMKVGRRKYGEALFWNIG